MLDTLPSPPLLTLHPGTALPVARYRFTFRMRDPLRLPEFAGSLIRGQFGASLRATACMTGAPVCPGCPLYRTCPYPAIFETPAPETHSLQRFSQVPNPYVIEPPPLGRRFVAAGETVSFHVVLIGRALGQLPLIAYAFQRAFERGVGKLRARGCIEDIAFVGAGLKPAPTNCAIKRPNGPSPFEARPAEEAGLAPQGDGCGQSVWDSERSRLAPHEPTLTVPRFSGVGAITLKITTPLRLQSQGHPVPQEKLRPRMLFTALLRRASLLLELHAGLPPVGAQASRLAAAAERLTDERSLQWKDWTRFSSRQKHAMTLGGVVGEWRLSGDLEELLPWFWLGQWLHVGKETTMGMGKYSIVSLEGGDG
ncbi:MAG TPA: CRISPR system precrRNA processing endoribonuclease RAMP protein Cas6 [Xanthobacteraceae bacterium]